MSKTSEIDRHTCLSTHILYLVSSRNHLQTPTLHHSQIRETLEIWEMPLLRKNPEDKICDKMWITDINCYINYENSSLTNSTFDRLSEDFCRIVTITKLRRRSGEVCISLFVK